MYEVYPPTKQVAICREMTKRHEEVVRGSIKEVFKKVSLKDIKGEVCLLVEGQQNEVSKEVNLSDEIRDLILKNMSPSEAAKLLSLITKQNKKHFYDWLIKKS